MILSADTLRGIRPVEPFEERGIVRGMSYGLSVAGYDIRMSEAERPRVFDNHRSAHTVASLEHFTMPADVVGIVHPKSTWARQGITTPAVVLEPGWRGHLTILLHCVLPLYGTRSIVICPGDPIAQVVFHRLDREGPGYRGKYQDQPGEVVGPRYE
jgi:dCTP deaminase